MSPCGCPATTPWPRAWRPLPGPTASGKASTTTRADSPTGRRYQAHHLGGRHALLFVRERRSDGRGLTSPYLFLGPAGHAGHEGSGRWQLRGSSVGDSDAVLPGPEVGGVSDTFDSLRLHQVIEAREIGLLPLYAWSPGEGRRRLLWSLQGFHW